MAATPLPVRCPQCGAEAQLYDVRCWLCGWSPRGGSPPLPEIEPPPIQVSRHEPRPWQFTIGGLLVITTVIAVCLGALRAAPQLGVMLIAFSVLSILPIIRARVIRAKQRQASPDAPPGDRILAYVQSFALTAGILAISF